MEQTHGNIDATEAVILDLWPSIDAPITSKITRDAYFAGIIDGEGSISIALYKIRRKSGAVHNGFTIKLYVTSTDRALIDWIQDNYGGKVYDKLNDIGHLGTKVCYRWQVLSRC